LRCSAKILILEGVDRCTEYESFQRIDAAFKTGNVAALQAAVDDPDSIPNGCLHPAIFESCLVYAIYHSPVAFIRTLLELGADPRPSDHMGFPPLIAALSRSRPVPGAPARPDVITVIELLLEFQADPNQRGINDYTALHMAVSEGNVEAVQVLLDAGADPTCRTRIDDCETPLEMARRANLAGIATLLSR
jgi:ankyrin repeat protein